MDTTFLKSNRFWALVILVAGGILKTQGYIDDTFGLAIQTLALGFITVGTVDKFAKNISGHK
jgi:hypothetical protein